MTEGLAYLLVAACMLTLSACSQDTKQCAKHVDSATCIQDNTCDWDADKSVCNAKPK